MTSPATTALFIVYTWSTDQALQDLDRAMNIQNRDLPQSQRVTDLSFVLRDHVYLEHSEEERFISNLSYLYGFTRITTAIGFPDHNNDVQNKSLLHFNALRSVLKLRKTYEVDTYLCAEWAQPSARVNLVDLVERETRERRRDLSLTLGVLFSILESYDGWLRRVRERMTKDGEQAPTMEERFELRQTFYDCLYVSRELLGGLAVAVKEKQKIGT